MNTCEAKRGFFTLYDCPKDVCVQCSECKRQLCAEHSDKEKQLCLECIAKKSDHENSLDSASLTRQAYQARSKSMADKRENTVYFGSDLHSYYSKSNIRSFDIELSELSELSDSPDELYFDS